MRQLRREADLYMASRLIHFPICLHCVVVKHRDLVSSVGTFKQGAVAQSTARCNFCFNCSFNNFASVYFVLTHLKMA